MSDTSLVFNLVARDHTGEGLSRARERFDTAAAGIGTGVAAALGVGVASAMDMSAANAKLAAQLGVGPAEAAKLSKVAADVYANNWGDSTEQVNEAIKGVYQNIGDVSQAKGGLEGVTSKALALAQTFDQEVGPTTAAVGQMLKTGLAQNANEAFDILTRGFQTGANKADDLLDTVNEYGTQWRKFGLDGQTAMGLLSQGLKGGARDADLVADSIKEFSIRAIDGSKTTASGFKAIGLDAGTMAAKIAKGGDSATSALDLTLDRLRGIKDPVKQSAAAVQLFGTQSEDLGAALYSLDPSTAVAALGKVGGAADKMAKTVSDSPSAALETFKRQATVKLAEVGGTFVQFAMDNQTLFGPLAATLGGVAAAILAVSVAQKVYATYTAIASAAQTIWNAEIWASTAALLANPMTWIVLAIVALIAVIVIIATKTTWFQTIWSTVWGAITSATSAAVARVGAVLGWFGSLPGKFGHWFGTAKAWAVAKLLALVAWVTGMPGRVSSALAGLLGVLRSRASNAFQAMRNAAVAKAVAFVGWVRGFPGRIAGAVGSLNQLLVSKGHAVVQGLWSGIQSMGGWIRSKLIGWAKSMIPGPIAKALGINSPSKVTTAQGRWIARGLITGMTGSSKQVRAASTKLADIIRDAMSAGARRTRALSKIGTGTSQLVTLANREATLATRLKTANKKLSDLIKDRAKLAADVKKGVLDSANVTTIAGEGAVGADTILTSLQDKLGKARQFAADLAQLRKKGVRGDLIAQIAQAGVDQGSGAAAALATADKRTIGQINSTQAQLVAAAGQAGSVAGEAMYGTGIQAARGLVQGLKDQEKAIERQMLKIAQGMKTAIKKALGIKSPSTLMANEVGRFIPPGVVQGMQRTAPQLDAAMRSLVRPDLAVPAPPSARPTMAPLVGAQYGGGTPRVIIDVRGADEDLKRLFRKLVRVDGRGNVQTAFGR